LQADSRGTTPSSFSAGHKAKRAIWGVVYLLMFRPTPKVLHGWRSSLLRMFGARVGRGAHPHPSCKIWAPWNLVMGDHSCLGPHVDCYNVAQIELGEYATVSQYSYLCGATHDYTMLTMPLVPKPIRIGARAWVAADAFVGPGITVGEGAVVGARACVVRDVPAWTVVAGNPARVIKRRVLEGTAFDGSQVGSSVA
jgi:putative colanic acid biosynthesis acetyltransferase WcaF